MKRTDKLTEYGFFNVDKPSGITSSTVVNKCKWLSGVPCGHMGTLDPLASGVLPVGVGNAARLFDYFLEKDKEYIAEFTFGVTSDTLDSTGELVKMGRVPTEAEIAGVLSAFSGEVLQMPPKYSAKSVNGRRGYELARAGVEFTLQPKKVRIDSVELTGRVSEDTFRFRVRCGGGTYIRSIARDIAEKLDTFAVMSALKRTQSGVFTLENALPFAELQKDPPLETLKDFLIPTERVLPFPTLELVGRTAERFFNGVAVETAERDGAYKVYRDGVFYGVAEVKDGRAKAKTKLC